MATVPGTGGPDVLSGTDEADLVAGGEGADTITGGRGTDLIYGDFGPDVFVFRVGDGGAVPHDTIADFQVGVDRLVLPSGIPWYTETDLNGLWVHYGQDLGNNDWVQLLGVSFATLDQLTGADFPSSTPTAGNDAIIGTPGFDAISALAGDDTVAGGDGADILMGGPGTDQMSGGAGADVFSFSLGDGGNLPHDVVTDFEVGVDRLILTGGTALHTEQDGEGTWVHYGTDRGNNDWIQLRGVFGASIEQLRGGGPPPTSPTAGSDSLRGTQGVDAIDALAGNDTVDGRVGNDTIRGGPGSDYVYGGPGLDVFAFAFGDGGAFPHDRIDEFDLNTDRLVFPTGAALYTEDDPGGQWVHYGDNLGNNDWVQVLGVRGASLAQLTGTGPFPPNTPSVGDDTLAGTSGADLIRSGAGDDSVAGGAGADTLEGGEGNDSLFGGEGNDVLVGGFGFNILDGGPGDDVLVLGSRVGYDPGQGAFIAGVLEPGARTLIVNFDGAGVAGGDLIDLSDINVLSRREATDVAFQFIGMSAFSGTAPQLRYDIFEGYTLVQLDGVRTLASPGGAPIADGVADAEFTVVGVAQLAATDFIL